MTDASSTFAILAFIAFAIPIVGALWKLFAVRESLQSAIKSNVHRIELLEQHIEHLHDQQQLAINGTKELVQHVRDRSARAEEKLAYRITDLEGYLTKTTEFSVRDRG
jgi:uncharacterized protein YoxC